jgi:hypothetical protein
VTEGDSGARTDRARPRTNPVAEDEGEDGDEGRWAVAWLAESDDSAYTKTETVCGVDFDDARPDVIHEVLPERRDDPVGVADASGEPVAEGVLAERGLEADDGTTIDDRLDAAETRE